MSFSMEERIKALAIRIVTRVRPMPVFVLDEYRAIFLLKEPMDGMNVLYGVWDGERNWA